VANFKKAQNILGPKIAVFVIRNTKTEAVRSLGISRKISYFPYLGSAEIAVASVRPGHCRGHSQPSRALLWGEVLPFAQPWACRCSKRNRWDSRAELELSQRGDDELKSRLSEHCVSWILLAMYCPVVCYGMFPNTVTYIWGFAYMQRTIPASLT